MNSSLSILSFHCQWVKIKLPIISSFCKIVDITALQESWILPYKISLLNTMDTNFTLFSLSAGSLEDVLSGRPFGGVSLLWKKSMGHSCSIIRFDEDRLLDLLLKKNNYSLLIMSGYHQSDDNLLLYVMHLSKIESIIENNGVNGVLIIGDFNADINKDLCWIVSAATSKWLYRIYNASCRCISPHKVMARQLRNFSDG